MPILKSAIKKLRQAKVKTVANRKKKDALKKVVDEFKKKPSQKALSGAFSSLDKAAKSGVLHKRKAARLKSRLAARLAR